MNRKAIPIISILLLSALAAPVIADDGDWFSPAWTVEATPNFIFSGDPFNVTVTEVVDGQRWVILNLRATNGTVIMDSMCQTDDLGVGLVTIEVPLETETGVYSLEVVEQGAVVVNCTVEIVQDDINWLHTLILEDRATIEQLSMLFFPMSQKVRAQDKTISDLWLIIIIVSIIAVAVVLVNLLLFKPWVAWKVSRQTGGIVNRGLKFFMHPPSDGDMTAFMESARAAQEKVLEDRERGENGEAPSPEQEEGGQMQFRVQEGNVVPNRPFGRLFRPLRRERRAAKRVESIPARPRARERREWSLFGSRRPVRPRRMEYEDEYEEEAEEPPRALRREHRGDPYAIPAFLLDEPEQIAATMDLPSIPMPTAERAKARARAKAAPAPAPRPAPVSVTFAKEFDPVSGEEIAPMQEPEPMAEDEPEEEAEEPPRPAPKRMRASDRPRARKAVQE